MLRGMILTRERRSTLIKLRLIGRKSKPWQALVPILVRGNATLDPPTFDFVCLAGLTSGSRPMSFFPGQWHVPTLPTPWQALFPMAVYQTSTVGQRDTMSCFWQLKFCHWGCQILD